MHLPKTNLRQKGNHGEDIATSYLIKRGYRILARNFTTRFAEIDIIAIKNGIVSFVEVKTRSSDLFGLPEEAVNKRKIRHITLAAEQYLTAHPEIPDRWQIDVVAILTDERGNIVSVNHIPSVTS